MSMEHVDSFDLGMRFLIHINPNLLSRSKYYARKKMVLLEEPSCWKAADFESKPYHGALQAIQRMRSAKELPHTMPQAR